MAIDPMTGEDDQPQYQPQVDPRAPTTRAPSAPPIPPAVPTAPPGQPDTSQYRYSGPSPAPTANVGHDGSQNGLSRDQYRDAWMSSGVKDMAGLRAWTAQHGGNVLSDNGTVQTPYGEQLDMLIGARTGNGQAGWTGGAGMQGANTGPGSGAPGAAGAAAAPAAGSAGDPNSFQGQIRAMLLAQMSKNSQPIDANDPTIKGELDSQDAALERTRRERRAAMAERGAAEGLNSGGAGSGSMDSEIAAGFEDKGTQMSAVRSQLFSRELTARRQTLNQQMQMALQTGDAESARALQLQISQADNQLRQLQLNQQQGQWNDQFGLQASNALYQRDRDAALYAGGQ